MDDLDLINTLPICKGHRGRPCVTESESSR